MFYCYLFNNMVSEICKCWWMIERSCGVCRRTLLLGLIKCSPVFFFGGEGELVVNNWMSDHVKGTPMLYHLGDLDWCGGHELCMPLTSAVVSGLYFGQSPTGSKSTGYSALLMYQKCKVEAATLS